MVSINLSDFFHDILTSEAFRPVSCYGDQWIPSFPVAPLEALGKTKSPPDTRQEKGEGRANGLCSRRNGYL